MFFQNLNALLAGCSSLVVTVAPANDKEITVTVIPKSKLDAKEPALATPFVLTGTPEELDAEFLTLLQSFTGTHKSLAEQAEATETVLEAAKQKSQKKATDAIKGSNKSSTTAKPSAPASADEEDETGGGGDGDDDNVPDTQPPAGGTGVLAASPDDLWK